MSLKELRDEYALKEYIEEQIKIGTEKEIIEIKDKLYEIKDELYDCGGLDKRIEAIIESKFKEKEYISTMKSYIKKLKPIQNEQVNVEVDTQTINEHIEQVTEHNISFETQKKQEFILTMKSYIKKPKQSSYATQRKQQFIKKMKTYNQKSYIKDVEVEIDYCFEFCLICIIVFSYYIIN